MACGVRTRTFSLFAALATVSAAALELCVFPAEWSGTWIDLQYGSRARVTFTRDMLTSKGRCVQSRPESGRYVLLRDAGDDTGPPCYVCMVFTRRTNNVIQYKEAVDDQMVCPDRPDLSVQFDDVCNSMIVNNKLYTLLREAAVPVACPIHGSYLFLFDHHQWRGCGNVRSQPAPASLPLQLQSKITTCASESQQLWSFVRRPCHNPALPAVENKNVQCISHWRDGENWMYIKYDTEYRCVKFSSSSGVITMTVAEDGTCDGMSDDKSPLIMRLTSISSVTGANSQTRCVLPRWTFESGWTDLSRRLHYYGTASRDELRQVASLAGGGGPSSLDAERRANSALQNVTQARYTCLSTQQGGSFYMRSVEGCLSGCRCISLSWSPLGDIAVPQIVTMVRGPMEECSADSVCPAPAIHAQQHDVDIVRLFDSSKREPSCPFVGAFKAQRRGEDGSNDEVVYRFGCLRTPPASVLIETRTCSTDSSQRRTCTASDRLLYCLASWRDGERDFLVIGRKAAPAGAASRIDNVSGSCYSYHVDSTTGSAHLVSDGSCNDAFKLSMTVETSLPLEIHLQSLRGKESCGEAESSQNIMSSIRGNQGAAGRCSRFGVSSIFLFIIVAAQIIRRWIMPELDFL